MLPESLGIGPISLSIFGVFVAISFVVSSFLLWRTLKEDFLDEEIITFTIFLVLFGLLGGRIFYILNHFSDFALGIGRWLFFTRYPGFSLIGAFLGIIGFTIYWSSKRKWDFWVLFDSLAPALLITLIIGDFGRLMTHPLALPLKFILAILVFIFLIFLKKNYRKFIWYKSGKPGFIAAGTTAIYFLGNLCLDFWFKSGLYLEMTFSLAISLVALAGLYRRSERDIKEDVAVLGNFLGGKFVKK